MTPKDLREALGRLGLDRQVDAARALGVTQGALSRWLSGARRVPRTVTLLIGAIGDRGPSEGAARSGQDRPSTRG